MWTVHSHKKQSFPGKKPFNIFLRGERDWGNESRPISMSRAATLEAIDAATTSRMNMIKSHHLSGVLGAALILVLLSRGNGAEIKVQSSTDKLATISLTGEVVKGDAEKFESLIKDTTTQGRVSLVLSLHSGGGLIDEAFKIASTVNDTGVATLVAEGATCSSACFIIFTAGRQKLAGEAARIGNHSVRELLNSVEMSPLWTNVEARALRFYRVPDRIIERTLTTIPDQMAWLSKDELRSMGVKLLEHGAIQQSNIATVSSGVMDSSIGKSPGPCHPVPPLTEAGGPPSAAADERRPIHPNAVAQRVILYEESPTPPGTRFVGTVTWQTELFAPAPGRTPEIAVRANIEIPNRCINATLLLQREPDAPSEASHTIEIRFNLPEDFPSGGIAYLPGALMKEAEQARGVPLTGVPLKLASRLFLVTLSPLDAHLEQNLRLLRERPWFDVSMVYSNGRRAILAIEKGATGQQAVDAALADWDKLTRVSRPVAPASEYEVKVASQRSEAAVKAAYKTLQQKYPNTLGNRQPIIRRVNLGDWGVYYRAQIGPFTTKDEAHQFCLGLKASGGGCIIQIQ
jgi:hypothetical protein